MASKKHNMLGFLHGGSRKKEKLDQYPGESSAAGSSTAQVRVSTSKQSTTEGTKGMLGGLFSRNKSPSTRPTTPTPTSQTPDPISDTHTTEQQQQQSLGEEMTDTPRAGKLASKQAKTLPEATATNKKKVLFLELGIGAIDLLSEVSDIAGLVLPNPVGAVLEKVTVVLGALKQMMENQDAWRELVKTLDTHQHDFNEQLGLLKANDLDTDPKSPLLGPIKQYSETLEEILAAIMKEGGLDDKSAPSGDTWKKMKGFCSKFVNASSEPTQVHAYAGQLSEAVNRLQSALFLYLSFKVKEMDIKMDGMDENIRYIYENIVSKEDQTILAKLKPLGVECGPQVSGCMEGTRRVILERIDTWTTDFDAPNILWLKGPPGVGKSAISATVVEQLGAAKRLGSRFFFQRQAATSMTTSALWRTVAYDLARKYPTMRNHLLAALKEDETIPAMVDVEKLFRQIIEKSIEASEDLPPDRLPIVVIDALDECGGLDGQRSEVRRSLVRTLASWSRLPGRFKLLVTSRDESDIARVFSKTKHHPIEISAGPVVQAQSSQDIRTFITSQLQERVMDQYEDSLPANWPGPQIVDDLADKAAGLFIWAQTVIKFINEGEPQRRLNLVLKGSGTGDMNTLYSQILSTAFGRADKEEIDTYRRVLGAVILAKEPLPFLSLRSLLSLEAPTVRHICNGLQSILESKDTLRFHHQSFVDFLVDPDRCPQMFLIRPEQEQRGLTLACLHTMKEELKFNICHLESSHLRNNDIPDLGSRIEKYIPLHLSYSCKFWAKHVEETTFDTDILGHVEYFMSNHFLFWLEVLSVTKQVNVASSMLLLLIDWLKAGQQDETMAREMRKFIVAFSSAISQSAAHIYLSALAFSPRDSAVSKQYRRQYQGVLAIETGGLNTWPAIQNVLEGHSGSVRSVAFSPDGKRVVSGSEDGTIRVWDAETGEVVAGPFNGHSYRVSSVEFSPDGKQIASGSYDNTVRVWDAETGEVVAGPFNGHSSWVVSVAFSPDGKRVVSGSYDETIRVWDAETGEVVAGPFDGHSGRVNSVAFSPDGTRIVSGSQDWTVRVWAAETGEVVSGSFDGHSSWVNSVAFSPDGKRVVSGSSDKTIRVWDAETGKVVAGPFDGHSGRVNSVAFSPDGKRIVSGSYDKMIRVWDAETSEVVAGPFNGHSSWVNSVAFSPDGTRIVSGSEDGTIRVWDAETGKVVAGQFDGHSGRVNSVAFSPDGKRIVSGSYDKMIRVWDAETGEVVAGPFNGHSSWVNSVAFSPDGKRVVSGSSDKTIRVWDAETGEVVAGLFDGHSDWVNSVAFSPDGTRIVSGSYDKMIRVWDAETGEVVAGPFNGDSSWVNSVAFSPDGTRIVSGSEDGTIRVWDAETGKVVAGPFDGHSGRVNSVAFSPDGKRIVSGSYDKMIWVWDAETGEVVAGPFNGHSSWVNSVAFSPDGTRIVSGSEDGTIRVWDAETGEVVAGPFNGHSGRVNSVAFSPDGTRIVSGSQDWTVRVWAAETGEVVSGSFDGHSSWVNSVAFSPDGKQVVSGSSDKTIQVWGADSGEVVAGPFIGHGSSISSVAFSPDGKPVISGSADKTIRVCDAMAEGSKVSSSHKPRIH